MINSFSQSYKDAGVDVTAGYKAVELIKSHAAKTKISGVLSGLGGFGGLFEPDLTGIKNPVLVSGTDGVGTKLKLAFLMDKHNTVGIDCVAMCVNDVICGGAKPLFFLDYIALGKNYPEKVASIVEGIAEGCLLSGCALIGGETAEMPGFYPEDEYDLAGFCVGIVDKEKIIDKNKVSIGDVLIGIPSSGVHSNGFSLIRKVFGINKSTVNTYYDELGKSLGEELITPTKIYVKSLFKVIEKVDVHGVCHVTGGGFYENIPRILKSNQNAEIDKKALIIPQIFNLIQKIGNISEHDMFNTFNMGTGLIIAVNPNDADKTIKLINDSGEQAMTIGKVTFGTGEVEIC